MILVSFIFFISSVIIFAVSVFIFIVIIHTTKYSTIEIIFAAYTVNMYLNVLILFLLLPYFYGI